MAGVSLYDYQLDAVNRMKNGCILCGGVGSGKSRTALSYYYILHGGKVNTKEYVYMKNPKDLYIITTARKRDTFEWEEEMVPFLLTTGYSCKVVIDSWNNIKKYADVKDAFFIFDEQRVVGYGVWTKTFLKIVKSNQWVLLSATPGDTWEDYIPVFIANGFYKSKTEFEQMHCVYNPFVPYKKVDRFLNVRRLQRLRANILVEMDFERPTVVHHEHIVVTYDRQLYRDTMKTRINPYTNEPFKSASEMCYCLRKIVNSADSRQIAVMDIYEDHPKLIIFYSYDYELEILKTIYFPGAEVAEWNGHKHQPLPTGDKWVYLVQYVAGCEGWNCITTDTVVFYSMSYSYKVMTQASGRIDRLNTKFVDLYYYHLKSDAPIDRAISSALNSKKNFNESRFIKWDHVTNFS